MHTSVTPRDFSSDSTDSQNLWQVLCTSGHTCVLVKWRPALTSAAIAVRSFLPGASATYRTVVGWTELQTAVNELHHSSWNA
jgi:56kDa selenium binding protein (SBP56)